MAQAHSAHVEAGQRLTPAVRAELRDAITSAGGNEIFAIGNLDEAGLVCSI